MCKKKHWGDHLDEFNKLIVDLENIKISIYMRIKHWCLSDHCQDLMIH